MACPIRNRLAIALVVILLRFSQADDFIADLPEVPAPASAPITSNGTNVILMLSDDENGVSASGVEDVAFNIQSMGGADVYVFESMPNMLSVRASPETISKFEAMPGVQVLPDPLRRLARTSECACNQCQTKTSVLQSKEVTPYGISMIQADSSAFTKLTGGTSAKGVTICVVDSGVDKTHREFSTSEMTGEPGVEGKTFDWDKPEVFHATHVTGIMAAAKDNAGVVGVIPGGTNFHYVNIIGNREQFPASVIAYAAERCVAQLRVKQQKDPLHKMVVSMSVAGGDFSEAENSVFTKLIEGGDVLLVAAAGNDGQGQDNYPAGYAPVVSVSAVDCQRKWAVFCNFNKDVELSAPGLGVLSSTPPQLSDASMSVQLLITGKRKAPCLIASPNVDGVDEHPDVDGLLVDCGLGLQPCTAAKGNICVVGRGALGRPPFACNKIRNCMAGGAIGAILYSTNGTCSQGRFVLNFKGSEGSCSPAPDFIPSVALSIADGATLLSYMKANPGAKATIKRQTQMGYSVQSGTSMATPHVSATAAKLWNRFPKCSNVAIRTALKITSRDLGVKGQDDYYGFGLIQSVAAARWLSRQPCAK